MKKTIVLMTIVLALLAAPVFAEVSISGDVDFGWSSDFAAPEDQGEDGKDGFAYNFDDVDLDFTCTVDEFTTATFSIEWDNAILEGSEDAVIPGEVKVVTDLTGALGMDSAADVSLITGYHDDFSNQSYQILTRREQEDVVDSDMDKSIVIGADVTVNDMYTITVGLNPTISTSEMGDLDLNQYGVPMAMFIGAYATIDALSVEAWYNMGQTMDTMDVTVAGETYTLSSVIFNSFGLSAAYAMPMDGMDFTFGAAFKMDSYSNIDGDDESYDDATMAYAVSAKMVMGAIDAAVALNGTTEANDVDATMGLSMDAGYVVNDIVSVYAGLSFNDLNADDTYFGDKAAADDGMEANAGAEFGAEIAAGAATYMVGYQIGAGDINNLTGEEGMFFRVKTAY